MTAMAFFWLCALGLLAPAAGGATPGLRGAGLAQVLVFDAGSSGTRVHIFNMHAPENRETAHVPRIDIEVRGKQTLKQKPGLSHFAEKEDLEGVAENINKLLDFAKQFVPEARRPSTPIMLKATAGLRAVKTEKAQSVLKRVREVFTNSGFRFQDDWVDIIQGKEEGGLAWIAANYLRGAFDVGASVDPNSVNACVGVIEMGGGSTQVTFEVGNDVELADQDEFFFQTAQGKRYRLYAHSYMGFGQDYVQNELRKQIDKDLEADPCYPKGYSRPSPRLSISGEGNLQDCKAAIHTRVISLSDSAPGSYNREQPLHDHFVATENFFHTQADMKLGLDARDEITADDLEAAGVTACSTAIDPSSSEDPSSPKHCFSLAYQSVLLQKLKASKLPGVKVKIAKSINGGDIDWAVGAALIHYLAGFTQPFKSETNYFAYWVLLSFLGTAFFLYRIAFGGGKASPKYGKQGMKIGAPSE